MARKSCNRALDFAPEQKQFLYKTGFDVSPESVVLADALQGVAVITPAMLIAYFGQLWVFCVKSEIENCKFGRSGVE